MKFIVVFSFFCLCRVSVLAVPLSSNESAAQTFLKESSAAFYQLYDTMTSTVFSFMYDNDDGDTTNTIDSSFPAKNTASTDEITPLDMFSILKIRGILNQVAANLTTMAKEVRKFPLEQIRDEELKIGLMNTKMSPSLLVLGDEYFDWFFSSSENHNTNNFCTFKKTDKCDVNFNDVTNIMKTTNNTEELLHYWTQLRDKNKNQLLQKGKDFVQIVRQAAKENNVTPKFLWFATFQDENFLNEMEKVVKEIEPFYKQLHAYIRHELFNHFGENIVSPTQPIPQHLFEQVISQAWLSNSTVSKHFKNVKKQFEGGLPNNFTSEKIVHLADDFMKSMGLSELPSDFWSNRVRSYPEIDDYCIPEAFDITKETYLHYCSESSTKQYLHMHGLMARIHYANQKKDLPFAYFNSYDLQYAVGEAMVFSVSTPNHLKAIGVKSSASLTPKEDLNRLYRKAIHRILNIPIYYVNTKVFTDILDGTIQFDEINQHYWNLMKEYVGVIPPVVRDSKSFDFPHNFADDTDTIQFVTEVIGQQIYKSLCNKSGKFVENNPNLPLHHCNLYGSKDAGKLLMEMMQMGSKKRWRNVLNQITGNDLGASGDGILEYYSPLQKWLKEQNIEKSVRIGW